MKYYSARTLLIVWTALISSALFAQQSEKVFNLSPEVIPMEYHGETVALRDFVADPNFPNEITKTDKTGYHVKKHWILNENVNPNALPNGIDPALQTDYPHPAPADRELVQNYAGMGDTGVDPADPSIDVGPNHVIQMINGQSGSYFRIWNKTGTQVMAQTYFDTFFGQPGGAGDPIVVYDAPADRWLMSEFTATGNRLSVAVSSTPDPLGTWYTYTFTTPNFPDYPKYSVWNNAYIVTTNENSSTVYALDRASMLTGAPATSQRFTMTNFGTIGFQAATPVNLDGTTLPPTGTPAMVMRMRDDAWSGAATDALEMWAFNINWTTPANSSLTQIAVLPVTAFASELCGYTSFACIPQPNSNTTLDPLREVLMNRIHYRNFGTHESIVCCHVVDVDNTDHAGMRWYELRRTNGQSGTWSIYQQGTYSPDGANRWMGAIGISASGNIGMAYNVSSSSVYPSLRYTGRKSCDPLGVMTEPETTIVAGTASNTSNRYGDYNAMGLDPADGETFWFTGMYNTSGAWSTRVAAFNIPSCNSAVQFSANTATADEASALASAGCESYQTLSVPITIGSTPSANANVTISVIGGTATQNVDYELVTTNLTFSSGNLSNNIEIHIFNDGIEESPETIILGYSLNANGGNAVEGTINQTLTITINDNDINPNDASAGGTILSYGFESGFGAFSTTNPSGATAWQVGTAAAGSTNAFTIPNSNATQIAWINDDDCDCNQNNVSLLFPAVNLTNYSTAALSFDSYFEGNTYQGDTETAILRVSLNGGGFTTVGSLIANESSWQVQNFDISNYVGNASVQFSIVYSDGTGWLYGCAIDNILITGESSVDIQTAVNTSAPTVLPFGATGNYHFYDDASNNIMVSVNNQNATSDNCVSVSVDRAGTNPTALAFTSNNAAEFVMSKTFQITTSNEVNANYAMTLFYKEAEVAAWESATGNSRNNIQMIRVLGANNGISEVTPANFGDYTIATSPVTIGDFNGDVTFTAEWNVMFGSFAMGIMAAIDTPPTAQFQVLQSQICIGETVQFQNQSSGNPTSWEWNFGDGSNTSPSQNPSHTYAAVGTYNVTLTVSNGFGTDVFEFTNAVTVGEPTSFSQSFEVCDGETIVVDGTEYDSEGTFTQILTNEAGCDSIVSTTIIYIPNPSVSISLAQGTVYCTTDPTVVLIGNPDGGSFSGLGVNGNSFSPATAGVGSHTIVYIYEDPNGCSATATVDVAVEVCQDVQEVDASMISIYPNPSNGIFEVRGLEVGEELKVYDSAGKLVKVTNIQSSIEKLDLNLSSGNYMISTKVNGVEVLQKVLIVRP
ncbi:MAG: PKD domain-containing protein [Flavobacteriales bacterium]